MLPTCCFLFSASLRISSLNGKRFGIPGSFLPETLQSRRARQQTQCKCDTAVPCIQEKVFQHGTNKNYIIIWPMNSKTFTFLSLSNTSFLSHLFVVLAYLSKQFHRPVQDYKIWSRSYHIQQCYSKSYDKTGMMKSVQHLKCCSKKYHIHAIKCWFYSLHLTDISATNCGLCQCRPSIKSSQYWHFTAR